MLMFSHLLPVLLQGTLAPLRLLAVGGQLTAQVRVGSGQLGHLLLGIHPHLLQLGFQGVGVAAPGLLQDHRRVGWNGAERCRAQQGPEVTCRGHHCHCLLCWVEL